MTALMTGVPSVPTSAANDPLKDGPPRPNIPNAPNAPNASKRSEASKKVPKDSTDTDSLAATLMGIHSPVQTVMMGTMQLEKLAGQMTQIVQMLGVKAPAVAQLWGPLVQALPAMIDQTRDLAAGALANGIQGGTGLPTQDATIPAPGPGGGAGPMPPGAGGAGGMLPPMPPPMG